MTRPRRSSRHRSREVALQVLYAIDLARTRGEHEPVAQEVFDRVAASFEMPEGAKPFAKELVCQTDRRRAALDDILALHARNWRLSRMAAVDRNILRLGIFELEYTDTPTPVVLDEAVGLARRFGSDRSPAFVNGILDAVARSVRQATSEDVPNRLEDEAG
jgi:N utilization substance protein B